MVYWDIYKLSNRIQEKRHILWRGIRSKFIWINSNLKVSVVEFDKRIRYSPWPSSTRFPSSRTRRRRPQLQVARTTYASIGKRAKKNESKRTNSLRRLHRSQATPVFLRGILGPCWRQGCPPFVHRTHLRPFSYTHYRIVSKIRVYTSGTLTFT